MLFASQKAVKRQRLPGLGHEENKNGKGKKRILVCSCYPASFKDGPLGRVLVLRAQSQPPPSRLQQEHHR